MKIVVQSKGKVKDYTWLNKDNEKTDPPNKISDYNEISDYLDTEDSSLILVRAKEKLILAITGLKSGRTDNRTRTIRNSVIWQGNKSEENQLHSLVIQYLENKDNFAKQIDEAVKFEPEKGFKIDGKIPEGEIPEGGRTFSPEKTADTTRKIGNLNLANCKSLKQDCKSLKQELEKYKLPNKDGILIFISEIKSQESLDKLNPWRGLSTQINSNDGIRLGKKNTTMNNTEISKKSGNLLTIILGISLIVSLIFNGLFWNENKELKRENQKLTRENQELTQKVNQIERFKTDIKTLEDKLLSAEKTRLDEITTAKQKFDQEFDNLQKQFQFDVNNANKTYQTSINQIKSELDQTVAKINQM